MSAAQRPVVMQLGDVIHGADLPQWISGGDWIEIDATGHGGLALVVWRMEDDDRTPECEAQAHRLVACWNACEGVPIEVLEANAAGGLPWHVADQIERRVEQNRLSEALRRLHDWAQAQAPNTDFGGDHPIALAREMLPAKTTGGAS